MIITRSGARAYHGLYYLTLHPISVRCDGLQVELTARNAKDFDTEARHNYELLLMPAEIGEILRAVCEVATGSEQGAAMRIAVAPHLPLLLRFAAACAEASKDAGAAPNS